MTETGFEFQIDEWDYLDGAHIAETTGWVAGSAGTHALASGQTIAFGRTSAADDTPSAVTLQGFDAAPAVIAQVTSANDTAAVTDRIDGVTAAGFSVLLQEEEAADQLHAVESVDWLALDYGTVAAVEATAGQADDAWRTFSHDTLADPVILADLQAVRGENPGALRMRDGGADSVSLAFQEETSADAELGHLLEDIAMITCDAGRHDFLA